LYGAERQVFARYGDRFDSLEEAREVATLLWDALDGWGIDMPVPSITVYNQRTSRSAWDENDWDIELSVHHGGGPRVGTVIHELGHAVMSAWGVSRQIAWHGPEFVEVFCDLMSLYTGTAADVYVRKFRELGVKVSRGFCPVETFGDSLYLYENWQIAMRADSAEDLQWWIRTQSGWSKHNNGPGNWVPGATAIFNFSRVDSVREVYPNS
jgi:hypothetical protein